MIEFVRIKSDYIEALRKVDKRVQSNAPEQGKNTKPFLGALFQLPANGITYYAPISSPKTKHHTMSNQRDFHKILDVNNNLLAVINFNNMVPVAAGLFAKIEFSTDKDKTLLEKEYKFCRDNENILKNKAYKLYTRYDKGLLSPNEKARTCDFHLLEKEMQRYSNKKI